MTSASLTNHTASNYNTNASFVYSDQFVSPLFDLLNAQPGEKIADLGCGTGELTSKIKSIVGPKGTALGIDSSESMLSKARPLSPDIEYLQADIQDLESTLDPKYKGQFDAIFTSATLHWTKTSPGGVLEGVKWLLKPGGRFIFEFGGFGNVVAIHEVLRRNGHDPHASDPWYFPTKMQYQSLLEKHDFTQPEISIVPRPSPLNTDFYGWLTTFARNSCFSTFDDQTAARYMKEVEAMCAVDCFWSESNPGEGKPNVGNGNGKSGWELLYVRIRGTAIAPP